MWHIHWLKNTTITDESVSQSVSQSVSGQRGMDFGVPQDRQRVYILGAKRSSKKGITNPPLSMPKCKGSKPSLSTLLLKNVGAKQKKKMKMGKTAMKNLKAARVKFEEDYARSSKPVIVDLAAGQNFARVCHDFVPTLLAGRCASSAYYWLQDRCRQW